MKHLYALLLPVFLVPAIGLAQPLVENMTASGTLLNHGISARGSGEWGKEQDQVNGRINNARLSKMKSVTDALVTFFHDSCITEGDYAPTWHGEYFSEKASPGPIMKFGVQCNFNDQKATLSVIANDLSPLLGHLLLNNKDVLTISGAAGVRNDCPYFEGKGTVEGGTQGTRSRIWLITAGNKQLPYTPLTRKEYLREARMELNGTKDNMIAEMKQKMTPRSAAVQEAEKKATLDQLNSMYSGVNLQVRIKTFLKNYKTDEEYQKENIEKGTADLDSSIHFMDSLLQHSPGAELDRPAMVSVPAAEFHGFEDGQGDKMLIKINTAWLNPYLSGEKPQIFLVCWQYDASNPQAAHLDRQIQEKLDSQRLKEMLGK